jgi:hypothetical protein
MFIPPMLCTTLRDPNRLGDACYIAEPTFELVRVTTPDT